MSKETDRIAELEAKIAALSAPRKLTFKVTVPQLDEKSGEMKGSTGQVSVYGLRIKFPVTMHAASWERLAAEMPNVLAFIKANEDKVSRRA